MSLFNELKRRNVFKVSIAYIVMAWLVMQVADVILNNITAPAWVFHALLLFLAIGLPFAVFFAWAFEMTPEGLKREYEVDCSQSINTQTGRKLDFLIIGVLVLALGYFTYDKFVLSVDREAASIEAAVEDASAPADDVLISDKSIAVLPFVNRSRSEDDAFFVDGVHDDLLTQLAKVSALKVISRTSVMRYRDTEKSIPDIGRELGVSTIMEGSVQRAGDRIRINVQLIDAVTDEHLWAESYDRTLTVANIFEIQSEIATAIAGALRVVLTQEETQRLAIRPTENLAAYEAYLLGRQRLARRTAGALAEAVNYFQQAVDLDPDFALAYVGLADSWQLHVDYGGMSLQEANARSQPMVEKALQLDDQSGEAYTSLASIREFAGDYEGAQRAYQRALELAPNYAHGVFWYGLFLLNSKGLPEDSISWFERALELDPLSAIVLNNYTVALEALGQFDEARAVIEKSLIIDPGFGVSYASMGYYYLGVEGRLDLGIDWLRQAVEIQPDNPQRYTDLAFFFSGLVDDAQAKCWADQAGKRGSATTLTNLSLSVSTLQSGDAEAAETYARATLENTWALFTKSIPLAIIKNQLQHDGQLEEALALYETHFPELLTASPGTFNRTNFKAAIDLAHLLKNMGREAEAEQLLDGAWSYIQGIPRLGETGSWVDDVRIHTLRGETELALTALSDAVQAGWRHYWRYYLEHDPILEPLRGKPRFQAVVDDIRSDMAEQLERVNSKPYDFGLCND